MFFLFSRPFVPISFLDGFCCNCVLQYIYNIYIYIVIYIIYIFLPLYVLCTFHAEIAMSPPFTNQAAQQIEVRKHQKVVEAAQQEGKES